MENLRQPESAVDHYLAEVAKLEQRLAQFELWMRRLIWLRLGLALPGIGLILFGSLESTAPQWTWQLGVVFMFGFLAAATWHENNVWSRDLLRQRLKGFRRLVARNRREWDQLPALSSEKASLIPVSDLSRDLDLLGDRSLYRWLSLSMTSSGAEKLGQWLLEWSDHQTILERQRAVRELARDRGWRMRFYETACNYQNPGGGPEGIVAWAESDDHFTKRPWLLWLTRTAPAVFLFGPLCILISKIVENEVGQTVGLVCMLVGAGLNFLLTMSIIGPIHDIFIRIGAANRELQSLQELLACIQALPAESELLQRLKEDCNGRDHSAQTALRSLQRIMSLAGMQRSALMFIPYLLLQVSVLWDIRVLLLLERWKAKYGRFARGWLDSIGQAEVLCAVAAVSDENPDWTYPELTTKAECVAQNRQLLAANGVAHPLLKDSSRVPNDVSIAPEQPLLLVTGSNMAGKSTLLRSIGVNAVMARTGSPVCARFWRSSSMDLASSIRVQDSLQDGVSFFMAELKRLRSVVDYAREQEHTHGRQMLVLLDEILQGTNSRERQIAVEHVLKRLVEFGCLVITSTHDLELASNSSIQSISQVVHFREHFEMRDGKQRMRFDYKMHPGVTPTTNALKLLEMVGL
jgi:predicted ATPase